MTKIDTQKTLSIPLVKIHVIASMAIVYINWNFAFAAMCYIVASELKDPIWHSSEWQIGSFSSEATIYATSRINVKSI